MLSILKFRFTVVFLRGAGIVFALFIVVAISVAITARANGAGGPRTVMSSSGAAEPAPPVSLNQLHSFRGEPDGEYPLAGVVGDAGGNLYGTTEYGGAYNEGSVYEIAATGRETILYSFTGGEDGAIPGAGVTRDSTNGLLYGTTLYGGTYGYGTVFRVNSSGQETVLYSFRGGEDGYYPSCGVLRVNSTGTIYGTTQYGGYYGNGTVFELTSSGQESVLYSFTGYQYGGGANPTGGVIRDGEGNLYMTTQDGGANAAGTVYRITEAGQPTLLHSFTGLDGANPLAGVILDAEGNLYGTTPYGGAYAEGVVYKVTAAGQESVLHSFTGVHGENPSGGLILDPLGNLYGTTQYGGAYGYGTIFEVSTSEVETVLYSFGGGTNGAVATGGLFSNAANIAYGTTYSGGNYNEGTVFKVSQ